MGLGPSLPPAGGIRRFRENELPIFYCTGCKFLWLAHWIKGKEDRGERDSVSLFNSDRTLSPKRPDAEVVRPVRLSVGTVLRVKHRTLGCVRSSLPDASVMLRSLL